MQGRYVVWVNYWHLLWYTGIHGARGMRSFYSPESRELNSGYKILLEQRYGRAVDWWAFGVLTYEMLLGQSPFRGDDEDEIFDAILEDEPLYPITMPRDAVSILQKVMPLRESIEVHRPFTLL
jgi:serine/threonine protein kinase